MSRAETKSLPRWAAFLILFGLYLSVRGYQSRDGDQAYRLPLLLHRQDPKLFADDPFVRAFDAFNPHRGYLALLDAASRLLGLSGALAGLYALTFAATGLGIDRLARAVWPEGGSRVGVIALALVLLARAGNVGTNHLFEATLLDRLSGFALGWLALGEIIDRPERRGWFAALAIGLAALIHPSVGLQLALLAGASWIAWGLWPGSGVGVKDALVGVLSLGLALVPAMLLHGGGSRRLLLGLSTDEFLLLGAYVQGPQHMLPHLWRQPQWLAWGSYVLLAAISLGSVGVDRPHAGWPSSRTRLAIVLGVNLVGLGLAWVAVEVVQDLRAILFQPFRMATVARGLALVAVAGRIRELWRLENKSGRSRAMILAVGLIGDWSMVVATLVEVVIVAVQVGLSVFRHRRFELQTGELAPSFPRISSEFPPPLRRRVRVGGRRSEGLSWSGRSVLGTSLPPQPSPSRGEGVRVARVEWVGANFATLAGLVTLGAGLIFLARHDTESGHLPLLLALAVGTLAARARPITWPTTRLAWVIAASWAIPLAAFLAPWFAEKDSGPMPRVVEALASRCRFGEVPVDDLERLAVWCRSHTPASARFIGPPGPKTFRLWSLRSLAFNRAGSPYHAQGLADWSARFRDHVGFRGSTTAFARAYLADRHGLEHRYQTMTDAQRSALARRQGATHVLAAAPSATDPNGPLELLHVEGRYAVYRVRR